MIRADILSETLLLRARAAGVRMATAESCTGGMLGEIITRIPGSSHFYEGGVITYSNQAKRELLGVRLATLNAHGAVSREVAGEMAAGVLRRLDADLAVSISGIAGPGGSGAKPEGRVCFGLALRGGKGLTDPETHRPLMQDALHAGQIDFGPKGREKVRAMACDHALDLLISTLPAPER